MPILYDWSNASRRIVVTAIERLETVDIQEAIERQRRESTTSCGVLYDLRGVPGAPPVDQLVRLRAEAINDPRDARDPWGPAAIVTLDTNTYNIACHHVMLTKAGGRIEVFLDREEAEMWLAQAT
jgi:hypothetical protein